MRSHSVSVVALSNRPYSSLAEKLEEAVAWLEIAAGQGAELTVLPEGLNQILGDGAAGRPSPRCEVEACDNWQRDMEPLIRATVRLKMWTTIPVVHRQGDGIRNSFFLISPEGEAVWQCDKLSPTPSELDAGILPGAPAFYRWKGITLGGAICFDTCFPENLEVQSRHGVELLLVPTLWPGGTQLNAFCKLHASRAAVSYPHWSRIIDIDGEEIAAGGYRNETLRFGFGAPVYTAAINFDRLSLFGNGNQEQMAEIQRKYGGRVRVTFDQGNCLWFLESRDQNLPEQEILREFGLVTATEYFAGCARKIRERTP